MKKNAKNKKRKELCLPREQPPPYHPARQYNAQEEPTTCDSATLRTFVHARAPAPPPDRNTWPLLIVSKGTTANTAMTSAAQIQRQVTSTKAEKLPDLTKWGGQKRPRTSNIWREGLFLDCFENAALGETPTLLTNCASSTGARRALQPQARPMNTVRMHGATTVNTLRLGAVTIVRTAATPCRKTCTTNGIGNTTSQRRFAEVTC